MLMRDTVIMRRCKLQLSSQAEVTSLHNLMKKFFLLEICNPRLSVQHGKTTGRRHNL